MMTETSRTMQLNIGGHRYTLNIQRCGQEPPSNSDKVIAYGRLYVPSDEPLPTSLQFDGRLANAYGKSPDCEIHADVELRSEGHSPMFCLRLVGDRYGDIFRTIEIALRNCAALLQRMHDDRVRAACAAEDE